MSTRKTVFALAAAGAAGLAAAAGAVGAATEPATATPAAASAAMHDAEGKYLGTVHFLPRADGRVAVRAAVATLPAGFHGFHVHAVGRCEPPSFTTAGGHHNPSSAGHGAHAGDMPVLPVGQEGVARVEFQTDTFSVQELLDADGSAVMIHAAPDNYANIPPRYSASGPDASTRATGDAGARIACGVVE